MLVEREQLGLGLLSACGKVQRQDGGWPRGRPTTHKLQVRIRKAACLPLLRPRPGTVAVLSRRGTSVDWQGWARRTVKHLSVGGVDVRMAAAGAGRMRGVGVGWAGVHVLLASRGLAISINKKTAYLGQKQQERIKAVRAY
jgi:hypothetical protein